MRVNGEPVLACMEEAKDGITIEPLNLDVKKDLVTDLVPRLEQIASLIPKNETVFPKKAEIDAMKPLKDCIECLCCVSVCPAVDVTKFLGPTAMRQEMRLVLDPRDSGDRILTRSVTDCSPALPARHAGRSAPRRSRSRQKRSRSSGPTRTARGSPFPGTWRLRPSSKRPAGACPGLHHFLEQVGEVLEPYGPVKATVGFFIGCMYNMRQVSSQHSTRWKCCGGTVSG